MLGTTEHAQTCIEVTEESFCYLFLHFIKCLFTTRFSKFQEALDFVPLHSLCSMWPLRLLSIYTGCDCPSLHGSVSSYRQPCLTELPFSVVSLRAPFFSHSENPTPGLHLWGWQEASSWCAVHFRLLIDYDQSRRSGMVGKKNTQARRKSYAAWNPDALVVLTTLSYLVRFQRPQDVIMHQWISGHLFWFLSSLY